MSDRQAQGLKGIIMAVDINITNRERIYINPENGTRIQKIQKGIINLENVRESKEEGTGNTETEENQNQ